jgi:hypothetical protein
VIRRARRLPLDDRGLLSFASLFAILALIVGFALVANIGKTVGQKLEAQNAADAAAAGAAVELARGMNAVTATNHIIGECQALVVVHHALGGDILDNGETKEYPSDVKNGLKDWYERADQLSQMAGAPRPIKAGYDMLTNSDVSPSKSGAAIYDSRVELYKQMTQAYQLHAAGAGLVLASKFPPLAYLRPIGLAMIAASMAWQAKVMQEWLLLNIMEKAAMVAKPLKKGVQQAIIPNLYLHSCRVAGAVPGFPSPLPIPGEAAKKAEQAAVQLGERHATEVQLFPGLERAPSVPLLALPVVAESPRVTIAKSQLVRASTPWIQWWRPWWMDYGNTFLPLSKFKCHFKKWTNEYTTELADRAKTRQRINLLVIRGMDPDRRDKMSETWTKAAGSGEADRLFSTMAFARREAPGIAAQGYFRQANPDGILAYAQAMVYNANPVEPERNRQGLQPVTGWDTLNWDTSWRMPEYPGPNPGSCSIDRTPEPRIKINWQSKLMPATRLTASRQFLRGETGAIVNRLPAFQPNFSNTH